MLDSLKKRTKLENENLDLRDRLARAEEENELLKDQLTAVVEALSEIQMIVIGRLKENIDSIDKN